MSGHASEESAERGERDEPIARDLAAQTRNERRGQLSTFSCPECGGVLWQLDEEGPLQFKCHVGHGYTGENLLQQKAESVEKATWHVMRSLKEVMLLSTELAAHARQQGNGQAAQTFESQARRAEEQLHRMEKRLLHPG